MAVELIVSGDTNDPKSAWDIATSKIFGSKTTGQLKPCPRCTFLGLCEDGFIKGIREGNYLRSGLNKNKSYAVKAVNILKKSSSTEFNEKSLWDKIITDKSKAYNCQMDVVLTLWKNNLIVH